MIFSRGVPHPRWLFGMSTINSSIVANAGFFRDPLLKQQKILVVPIAGKGEKPRYIPVGCPSKYV